MKLDDRIAQIDALIPALRSPALVAHIREEVARLTERLVSADDEQTRGRIKALRDLINSPDSLQSEREGIAAALSEQSDAA